MIKIIEREYILYKNEDMNKMLEDIKMDFLSVRESLETSIQKVSVRVRISSW